MKYYITTFGCQTNQSDSERITAILEKNGCQKAPSQNDADLIVVNACSVRQSAVDRIHGIAKKQKGKKTKKPLIILTGCVLEKDRKKFAEKFDIILDIRDIKKLPRLLKSYEVYKTPHIKGRARINDIQRWKTAEKSLEYFNIIPSYQSSFRAYVPIMTGCNNFCTYCAVPYARGKEVSRPIKDIINEVKNLVKNGYKEITLLGQNVNSYKGNFQFSPKQSRFYRDATGQAIFNFQKNPKSKTLNSKQIQNNNNKIINFADLLKLVNDIPGDFWIRFQSSHPKDFTDELIDTITQCEKVTEYISLPIQSGNDKILKKMNRPYTVKQYKNLVAKIRKKIPNATISTDFILGFPDETKKQFKDSVKLFRELKFDMAYIAQYSSRPGTAAAKILKDNVPTEEKKRRERELTKVLRETSFNINKKLVGKIQKVLVEKEIKRQNGHWLVGKTRGFKTVKIPARLPLCQKLIGQFVNVKIVKARDLGLIGKII